MSKTIHILGTHYGDHKLDYERFFYDNRHLLDKAGIAYPWLSPWRGFAWQIQLPQKLKELKDGNAAARNELEKALPGRDRLLFVAPAGVLGQCLPELLEYMENAFPEWAGAKTSLAWLACERAREMEGAAFYNLPRDATDTLYRNSLKNAFLFLQNLAGLLRAADNLEILPDSGQTHLPEDDILKALRLDLPREGRVPLIQTAPESREAAWLSAKLNALLPEGHTRPEAALRDSSFTLLSPARLRKIYETVSIPMQKLASQYGVDLKFPEPEDQPGWRPLATPGQNEAQAAFARKLEGLAGPLRDYSLRVAENAVDMDWLANNPAAFVQNMRGHFGIAKQPEPLLCVLTLTKNQAPYIAQCIESVLEQKTDFPVRHIILDDCSSDGAQGIIRDYAKKYQSIYPIFLGATRGPGENVSALFSACRSKYASLCDGDDYFIDPRKLQKQVDFLEAHPDCTLCFHPVEKRYEDGSPTELYPPASMLPGGGKRHIYTIRDLLAGNMIQTNAVVYRWRFREGLPGWFNPTLTPSDWYWHLLHAELGMIGYLPEAMSVYRRHASSLFASAEKSHVQHRALYGNEELRLYATLDGHFKGRYREDLQRLANGVFADYLRVYLDSGDDTLLNGGVAAYPAFAKRFLSDLKLVSGTRPKTGN